VGAAASCSNWFIVSAQARQCSSPFEAGPVICGASVNSDRQGPEPLPVFAFPQAGVMITFGPVGGGIDSLASPFLFINFPSAALAVFCGATVNHMLRLPAVHPRKL
jgi:hypothetical protein